MIRFACPSCDKTLAIDTRYAGRKIACPNCKSQLTIPAADAPVAAKDVKGRAEADYAEEDERMRLKRQTAEEDDLDMTPMVDVTFLLLIFFMITASFQLQKSMQASPPDPDDQAAAAVTPETPKDDPIVVEIDESDVVYVDGETVFLGDLRSRLEELRISEQVDEVTIEADRAARHGTVVSVSDSAIRAGFSSVKRTSVGGE